MSLVDAYTSLVKYRGLSVDVAMAVHSVLLRAHDTMGSSCMGFMPLSTPSLPAPDDVVAVRRARSYAMDVARYLRALERCSKLYESLSRLGSEAWDSFYLYHLADIASTRLSGAYVVGVKFDQRLLDTITLDLKEIELSIYNIVAKARWALNPLIAAYEYSPAYRAIVDALRSEGYLIEDTLNAIALVEIPRLNEELLKWVKSEGRILQVVLRPLAKRKAIGRALRAKADPEAAGGRVLKRLERILGPRLLSRLPAILASEKASTTKNMILCIIAKEAADCSSLYPYLLASPKPLSLIKSLWRPPKCPYPGFTWPLERVFREHIAGNTIEGIADAIKPVVETASGGRIEIPDSVINKYTSIVTTIALNLLKPGHRNKIL